jgi:hypothetical protein
MNNVLDTMLLEGGRHKRWFFSPLATWRYTEILDRSEGGCRRCRTIHLAALTFYSPNQGRYVEKDAKLQSHC